MRASEKKTTLTLNPEPVRETHPGPEIRASERNHPDPETRASERNHPGPKIRASERNHPGPET